MGIPLLSEYRSDRNGDIGGIQTGRGNLVQERLEQMVVPPVDDRDVDRSISESLRCVQAGKSGTDDDDTRPVSRSVG
jgi:hypothetical protein